MILGNVNLKPYNTMRLEVWTDYFCQAENAEDIAEFLQFVHDASLPWLVLGGGSNVVFSQDRYNGAVLVLYQPQIPLALKPGLNAVSAFVPLARLVDEAVNRGLGDLTFLYGIPGTVGGAVVCNAGTVKRGIAEIVREVRWLDENLKQHITREYSAAYRYSEFMDKKCIITELVIWLEKFDSAFLKTQLAEMKKKREAQPIGLPSAGSVFKNPPGKKAWQLVDEVGLRGYCIGEACVSEKHANFIVNKGNARPQDILALIELIEQRVYEKTGIRLEREVRVI